MNIKFIKNGRRFQIEKIHPVPLTHLQNKYNKKNIQKNNNFLWPTERKHRTRNTFFPREECENMNFIRDIIS